MREEIVQTGYWSHVLLVCLLFEVLAVLPVQVEFRIQLLTSLAVQNDQRVQVQVRVLTGRVHQ